METQAIFSFNRIWVFPSVFLSVSSYRVKGTPDFFKEITFLGPDDPYTRDHSSISYVPKR